MLTRQSRGVTIINPSRLNKSLRQRPPFLTVNQLKVMTKSTLDP